MTRILLTESIIQLRPQKVFNVDLYPIVIKKELCKGKKNNVTFLYSLTEAVHSHQHLLQITILY